jgi:signal transduction histidine kinase
MGALVALVAAAAVGLVARGRVEGEFRQFLEHDDLVAFDRVAGGVRTRLAKGEPLAQVARAFERDAAALRRPVAWVSADDSVVAASAELAGATIRRDGPRVFVTRRSGRPARTENFVWVGLPRIFLPGGHGALLLLPSTGPVRPEAGFRGGVQRGLVHAALFGLLAALVLSLFLGRAIARGLEELTRAARDVAAGDRTRRVTVRGNDEIAKLGASFNALVASIERGETLRQNLVADVAHELRTPVTNLKGQLEALEDGLLAPTPQALASLREETDRLARLIDDLQQVALAEALPLERAPVDLAALLAGVAATMQGRALAQGVAVTVGGTGTATGDRARLAQVVANLLDNALTHTPRDGHVALECAPGRIVVRDDGEGIAPAHLPFVFERLYRADPSRQRATGGAGLGLAIVRQLIEAHGGTVALASDVGQGTTVTITLPS